MSAALTIRIDAAGNVFGWREGSMKLPVPLFGRHFGIAEEISRLAPMGMIFVPSHAGISHAPQEFAAPGDVANGVEVLYRTILLLDKRLDAK